MQENKWVRLSVYMTALVNQRLLLQNEYSMTENQILRSHLPTQPASPTRNDSPSPGAASASQGFNSGKLPTGETAFGN